MCYMKINKKFLSRGNDICNHIYVMCVKVLQDILFKYNKISSKDSKEIIKNILVKGNILFISPLKMIFISLNEVIIFIALTNVVHYFLFFKEKEKNLFMSKNR